jgi:hypothetical protein
MRRLDLARAPAFSHRLAAESQACELREQSKVFSPTNQGSHLRRDIVMKPNPTQIVTGVVIGAVLAGGGYAFAASSTTEIHGCVSKKTHTLTVTAKCGKQSTALTWSERGPAGAKGAKGANGARGTTGTAGAAGSPATVTVGSVATSAPGTQATVTNVGTANSATLNFTIPQGSAGTNGTSTGPTAYGQIWIGGSMAELAPGRSANIVGEGTDGTGGGDVDVQGCSSAGLADPVISVTADKDPHDTLAGANNTANVADAYVSGWSTEPNTTVLVVDVDTTNPVNGQAVLSDFSVAVTC